MEIPRNANELVWRKCSEGIPLLSDRNVQVYFSETDAVEDVHVEDYFKPITAGTDPDTGSQLFTRWYESQSVTHWMELPERPYNR